jgi:hypothetical protein
MCSHSVKAQTTVTLRNGLLEFVLAHDFEICMLDAAHQVLLGGLSQTNFLPAISIGSWGVLGLFGAA